MVGKLAKYFKIWKITTGKVTQIAFISRLGAAIFVIGKILRFAFFLMFLVILGQKTRAIAGYSIDQIIFAFATFNIIDTTSQLLFREVYRFRYYITSGEFDYFLTKPISPLVRSLFGGSDVLDLPVLLISIVFVIYSGQEIGNFTPLSIFAFIALILNALLIALSLHIIVLAIGVMTTEIDHTIMIYRDITQMGRLPIDIYREPLSWILTFILPVGIMMTVPAKSFFNLLSLPQVFLFLTIAIFFLIISLKFWSFALKNYTSVSS